MGAHGPGLKWGPVHGPQVSPMFVLTSATQRARAKGTIQLTGENRHPFSSILD